MIFRTCFPLGNNLIRRIDQNSSTLWNIIPQRTDEWFYTRIHPAAKSISYRFASRWYVQIWRNVYNVGFVTNIWYLSLWSWQNVLSIMKSVEWSFCFIVNLYNNYMIYNTHTPSLWPFVITWISVIYVNCDIIWQIFRIYMSLRLT